MRLKRLEIRGFKTFANPVQLEFNSPLTAIVGPNGSGKSNIADAVRWVLGEQSLRALRTKKTEDIIYAGGNGRAQLGMAEVALTLDNEDGWLDVPYAEVCLLRRAYRSGENEYFLNGARVRLRDLNDLVLKANVGPASTVIGQGMVDLALSLRPEERRFLFEEAADIKRHYLKIKEAQDKLAATEDNMRRVADLAAELAPRVASLARQAERARRHAALAAELRELLLRWYRRQWCRAQAQLRLAVEEERRVVAALQAAAEAVAANEAALAGLAARREQLIREQQELAAELGELAGAEEAARLELAVGRERLEALSGRRTLLERRLAETAAAWQRAGRQASALAEQRAALAAERERLAGELAQLSHLAAEAQRVREARGQQLRAAEAELERLTEAWAQTQAAVARLTEQCAAAAREGEQRRAALRESEARLAEGEREIAANRERLAGSKARLATLAATLGAQERAIAAAEAELAAAEGDLEQRRRDRHGLQARLAALARWHQELSGYHGGVRSVLQAARGGAGPRLLGIVGVVAELLRVPAHLELAVEVALGGRLQDVVVERWRDAEAAIEHLKRTRGGRATFLPLDTLRQPPAAAPAAGPGVLGIASDLVAYDPAHAIVARHLLGRTIVVQDLAVARRTLESCPPGWQIVTLAGEVVRASGALTGGTLSGQQSGLLGQERELREGPARLAALDRQIGEQERATAERRAQLRELRAAAAATVREEREATALSQQLEAEGVAWQREGERLRRAVAQAAAAVQAAEQIRVQAGEQLAQAGAELSTLATRREAARARLEEARAGLAALETSDGDAIGRLAAVRAALAAAEREDERLRREEAERNAEAKRLGEELAGLEAAAAENDRQARELHEALAACEARHRQLAERHAQLAAREAAARAEGDDVAAAAARLEERRRELYAQQAAAGAAKASAAAAVQQAQAELAALRERIGADFALEPGEGPQQLRLPWPEDEPASAAEEASPEQLRRQIDQLRAQLRSLGGVSAEAVHDYEELAARHAYLTSQHADLQQAARTLRQAIADLEQTMRRQFTKTFALVAAEFRRTFATLFGGGTARISLTQPDNVLETGVEIVAQPPGKRLQNLALLSGGERALTAVALLFAILRVRPAPFCVLDEVDAALDDTNVARFAEMLAELGARTQFVVITHNRGTMQAAGTLYGVTIGHDGVSRLVSLRLADLPAAAEAPDAGRA